MPQEYTSIADSTNGVGGDIHPSPLPPSHPSTSSRPDPATGGEGEGEEGGRERGSAPHLLHPTVHIDTVSMTRPLTREEGERLSRGDHLQSLRSVLDSAFGTPFGPCTWLDIGREHPTGRNGYHQAWAVEFDGDTCGFIAVGGNNDTCQLYLDHGGCLVAAEYRTWERIADRLNQKGWRLTRADVAADDYQGDHSVDLAVEVYQAGGFDGQRGVKPGCNQVGNWLDPDQRKGRTLYVGSRQSHKLIRVYEKGKQLGMAASPWTRWEVEFKRDTTHHVPLDILRDPVAYLVGAYPHGATAWASGCGMKGPAQRVELVARTVEATLDHLVIHARRSYGRLLHVLTGLGADVVELLTAGVPVEAPRRLKAACRGITPASNTGVISALTLHLAS